MSKLVNNLAPSVPIKQLRGVKDLLKDAGVDTTEQVHLALARKPYAVLEKINMIATPVHVVERVQHAITVGVYQSIRTINALSAAVATEVIDRIERSADKKH